MSADVTKNDDSNCGGNDGSSKIGNQQFTYKSLINEFSSEQISQFMQVIDACHKLSTEEQFIEVIRGPFRQLVPHQYAACGIGERGKLAIDYYINVDFPAEYMSSVLALRTSKFFLNSPIAKAWAKQPETTFIDHVDHYQTDNEQWMTAVQKHKVGNMLVSGLHDLSGNKTSYFCFARCPNENGEWFKYVVDLITPHLHRALTNVCSKEVIPKNDPNELTGRELEVLTLVGVGLTNTQIGEKLFISENTVKNHVQSIFKKLNVVNRVQAVSRAYGLRLINEPEIHLIED